MGAAESKAVAVEGGSAQFNNDPSALQGIAAAAGAAASPIPPSVTNMGNNASVPAQDHDPNLGPAYPDPSTITVPAADEANDLQHSVSASDPEPSELQPTTSLSSTTQEKARGKDTRPAFLRRLTTAPSAVSTAATHAENVSANPSSSSPAERQMIGAKEHLTKSNASIITRSSPPSQPVELAAGEVELGQHLNGNVAPASITLPPSRPSTSCSVSSLGSADNAFVSHAHWDSIHHAGGDVSPLDRSLNNSPAPGSFRKHHGLLADHSLAFDQHAHQYFDHAENNADGGANGPVALSEGDLSWRQEFFSNQAMEPGSWHEENQRRRSLAAEQRLDMALESLRRNSIPASVATGQTFGSFAHPYGGYEDEESLDEHPFEIRPEYLPLPDDATDGTADDELSISLATSADFDQRYSTGETSQMTAEFGRGEECDDQKLAQSSASLQQSPLEKSAHGDEEVHADQTESDTEVDKATTVGNFDDVGIPEGDAAVSDNVSEIHVTTAASASGGLDDDAPLRDSGPGNNGAALDSEAQDKQSSIEQIISSDGPTDESVEQPKSDTKAVDSLSPAPEEQKINIDVDSAPAVANDTAPVSITTDPESESKAEEITADEAPEQPIQSAEDAQEEAMCQVPGDAALSHPPIEISKIDVLSETNQVEEELNSIKEPGPVDQESHHAFGDLTATAATAVDIQDDESSHSQPEENSAGLQLGAKIIEDASLVADQETKSINATAFPAAEASVVIEKEETSMHSEEGASQHASVHAILSMSSSPQSSARYPASSEAAESVSLKDMLQESRLMEPSRDDVASRNGQGEADLVLLSSLSKDEKSQNGKEAQPRRNRGMPEAADDDDGWAIPGREQQEPQSQLPTRQRRKSLPMLFKDMKESRKEKKSLLPVKKEAKESKLALPSKKDHKPVLATAAMRESRIPTAPLSASMAEGPKSPFSPGKKGRNVLQRNSSTSRLLDQSLPSPVKDKERRKRGSLLGAVFGRSSTPGPDLDKERERQMEKLNKEREKQKEPKPKKKGSKSKLVIPPRRYSLAGPLGGHHDHLAPFAAPRVPTPKRVQEISALSHFEGPSKTQERPRSGNSSLDSQPHEERPTSAADLAAAVAAAVDANHIEIKSRVRRPGVIPEPGPEWEEWEQKARELEGNRTKVNGSPASGISIPAVLHGPGTPTQAKLYPHDPDSYPFYQFAPPALPPHLQAPSRPFYYSNPPRSATFNESPTANQFSSGYGSLQRRYSEHFSVASARGLPPFPPHLYGLRDGDYPAHPLRQTSQPQLRPHSNAGPSSPIAPGSAPHGKSPEQEAIEMAGASASPIASNAATVDSYEQDSTFVPPPIPLPGETMEQFLEKQRIWYEHHAQAANRRDSGYSPQYGFAAQQGMPFPPQDLPPHLAQGFYPYPPQWYWAQGYPPPPPQAYAHLFPPANHSPEDYYHQTLREQQQQERANSDTDSPRDKSPIPAPYGFPGPFPPAPPRSAYAHTPAAPGPYGYPRQEMRWRDLTSEGPVQGQQISHKRIDSGAYAGQASPTYAPGAGSMSAHQQGPNAGRDVDDEKAQHPKTGDAKSSASSRDAAGKQNAELARRQTVSGGARNSNSKLETVMEPVELADTDVGRRTSSGLPEMHAASYPGMEWMPEGYVEE